jgi:hypothetical protein
MRSSTPTGTITATARAVLAVLEADVKEEQFTREEAIDVLTTEPYPEAVDEEATELLEPLTEADYEMYLDVLLSNGYLYDVDGRFRITS